MSATKRLPVMIVLFILLLTSGTALAVPELLNVSTSLQGALIPGGEILFTAEGTPGCVATLTLTITTSGSSTPLIWPSRMQEEANGVYVYRWTTWENMDVTLTSALIQLKDDSGELSRQLPAISGPVSTGGSLRGKITDALTGTPLPDIQVMAYSPSTRHYALAFTNQRGEYTLAGLGTAKDYRLWTVNDQGYTEAKKEKLSVYSGGSTDAIDLALTGLSAVSGYVEDENGTALVGVDVTADQRGGATRRTAATDDRGRFIVAGLIPGSYDLTANPGESAAWGSVETVSGKIATASFRLASPRQLSICEISIPGVSSPAHVIYWPSQGGPVRLASLTDTGTATLTNIMTGDELVLSLMVDGQSTAQYSLRPMDQGPYSLEIPIVGAPAPTATPSLTFASPLITRGGSALLSGRVTGFEWVDLWLDGQWEARLPVITGRWQTSLNLDQGEHRAVVMTVGDANALSVERPIAVSRALPSVLQIKVNQQPHPSWFSGDGGGELHSAPKQPITLSLSASQAGATNWFTLGERQWVMGKLNDTLTATIPADAVIDGEHPLTWRWERQGKQGEVALGTLVVRKPVVRSVVDAITGEPIAEATAALERFTDRGWEIASAPPVISNAGGQLSLWLAEQSSYRLRITKPGYQASLSPIDPASVGQGTVIPLVPIRPNGPISLSPGRDARDVDPSGIITVTFARDLAPKSINADTFYIQGVGATVTYDPLTRKARLEPNGKLSEDAYYLVHLSGRIRYADGTPTGRGIWWLISTADATTEEDRSSASKLAPVGQAANLAPRDNDAKAIIPTGSSPVQTLYRLTRPSTLPRALPVGWQAVATPLSFTATNSPLDRPIHMLQQGAEISILYTNPPEESQAVTLWRYDPIALAWMEHPYEHDLYLRTVRFTTDRPGIYVFAKQQ